MVFTALIYVAALAFFAWGADQIPHRLCIRGTASRGADLFLLGTSVACFIVVLFYALDSAQLTGRMLRCLSAASTRWPLWVVQKFASQKCVRPQDLDGWLDVQVAAEKGMETRRLMFLPFILLFLLLVARLPVFEHWTWPAGLSLIFAVNFVLAGTCWAFVRYSARKVKQDAVARLKNIEIEIRGGSATVPTTGPCNVSLSFSKEEYASRLRDLCKEIEDENRGPFVRWIQDPAVIALLIPTGLTGIIAVVLHYWLTDY